MAGNVIEITDATFDNEVTQSAAPVLVDFWADWCGPCRMLSPAIEELAEEYRGKVKVGKVNTENSRDTAVQFGITAIPTVIVFKNGKINKKFVGLTAKKDLKAALDAALQESA